MTLPPLIAFFGIDRELISERLHPGPGARERLWVAFLVVVPLAVGHVAIGRLDVGRFTPQQRSAAAATCPPRSSYQFLC